MKGITLCADCAYYSMKKHCCTRGATKETDPRDKFYDDCPLPEAAPVRHGEWEWRGGIPWCSNCGEMPPGYSYDGDVNTTTYCPNCGAKMDGDSDGNS